MHAGTAATHRPPPVAHGHERALEERGAPALDGRAQLCDAQGEHALDGLPAGIAAEVDVGKVLLGEVGGFECRGFAVRSEELLSSPVRVSKGQ